MSSVTMFLVTMNASVTRLVSLVHGFLLLPFLCAVGWLVVRLVTHRLHL